MSAFIGCCVHFFRNTLKQFFPGSRHPFLVDRTPYGLPVPLVEHRVVPEEEIQDRRLLIVGDVHGCYDELVQLLDMCNARDPNVCVAFVGDIINKGPNSPQVVQLVRELGGYCVRGNHDEVSLREWQRHKEEEESLAPSFQWLNELSKEEIDWLFNLPFTLRFPSRQVLLVHAGAVPGVEIAHQKQENLLHMRDVVFDVKSLSFSGYKKAQPDSQPWAQAWEGPDHIYFGHDARRYFQSYQYATGLDTGCVYGGYLTGVFTDKPDTPIQVQAKSVYKKTKREYNAVPATAPPKLNSD